MKRFELLRRGTPDLPHFECGPFNHLGTSPYISVCCILEKFLERKAGENTEKYSIFCFENPLISRISGGRNDQAALKFRVSPVMTTSIRLHMKLRNPCNPLPADWLRQLRMRIPQQMYYIKPTRKNQGFSSFCGSFFTSSMT